MGSLALLALAALAVPQAGQGELPFYSLGKKYIEQADARRTEPVTARGELRLHESLEPLHRIVRVGVIELWVPEITFESDGETRPGPDLAAVRPYARLMVELQREWLSNTGLKSAELARHVAALEVVGAWVKQLDGAKLPEVDKAVHQANRMLEVWFQKQRPREGVEPEERPFELVMILAPTRAHYFGLLGASGLLLEGQRDVYWHPAARRSVSQWLTFECLAVAMAMGPTSDRDPPLVNDPMDAEELEQQMAHAASHLLSNRVIFEAPSWFREGIAIRDTVALTGDDDTLCSGYSESRNAVWSIPALASLLPYLERDLSPYRDGPAAHFFPKLLRPDKDGKFEIHDIDLGKRAFKLAGPFLDADDRMPDEVFNGSEGIKRGFAEFMRAYGAAFVEYLSQQRLADRSVLAWTIEFIRNRSEDLAADELLPTALRMITMKSLGESPDPARDLEAAFDAWLGTRK